MSWRPSTPFTGRTPMTVPEALEIKQEPGDHRPAAQAAERGDEDGPDRIIDLEELAQFASRRRAANSAPCSR